MYANSISILPLSCEPPPLRLLSQLLHETTLVKVTKTSTLLHPILNFQFSILLDLSTASGPVEHSLFLEVLFSAHSSDLPATSQSPLCWFPHFPNRLTLECPHEQTLDHFPIWTHSLCEFILAHDFKCHGYIRNSYIFITSCRFFSELHTHITTYNN